MIIIHNHGPVRELQLNRPPANALSPEFMTAIKDAVEAAPRDGARAIVLSGSPGRFCFGLDVPLLLTLDRPAIAAAWRNLYALMRALASSPIPVAAAITGHAPAGGTVLSLFCDWRVMADGDFIIGLNEVQVGLPVPPVILSALERLLGRRQAEHFATAGLLVKPAQAARAGLVDEVVPASRVVKRAVEWCQALLAVPSTAMSSTRRRTRADLVALFDNWENELDQAIASWWSEEAQRVLRALADRLQRKSSM